MAERLNAATLARHPDTGAMVFLPAGSVPPAWAAGRLGAHLFGEPDTAGPGPDRRRLRRARSAEHAAGTRSAERRDSSPAPRPVGPDREAGPDPDEPAPAPMVAPGHEADPAPEPDPAGPFTPDPEPDQRAPEPGPAPPAGTSPEPPPRHGRGASAAAWRAWADAAGVDHDPDASRDEIIAAAVAAGALTA